MSNSKQLDWSPKGYQRGVKKGKFRTPRHCKSKNQNPRHQHDPREQGSEMHAGGSRKKFR